MNENRYRVFRERPGEWIVENTHTKAQFSRNRWRLALDLANTMARRRSGFHLAA